MPLCTSPARRRFGGKRGKGARQWRSICRRYRALTCRGTSDIATCRCVNEGHAKRQRREDSHTLASLLLWVVMASNGVDSGSGPSMVEVGRGRWSDMSGRLIRRGVGQCFSLGRLEAARGERKCRPGERRLQPDDSMRTEGHD